MSTSVAVVMLSDLSIPYHYQSDLPQQHMYGGPWGNPYESRHIMVPEDLNPQMIKAIKNENDDIEIVEDPDKKAQFEEMFWTSLRQQRNQKLADTDWTRLDDAPLTNKQRADFSIYRQELRDLPSNTVDPQNPDWPVPPL